MTAVDISIIAIVVLSCLLGIWRGLLKEAVSLATWIAAIFISGLFSGSFADLMSGFIHNSTVRAVLAFSLLFIVIMFVGTWIGNLISKLGSAAGLRGTDRVLGAMFGVLRGAVIVMIAVFLTTPFAFSEPWYENSILVPYVFSLIDYIQSLTGLNSLEE